MNIIINVFASSSLKGIKLVELLLQKCKDSLCQYILSLLEEKHEDSIDVEHKFIDKVQAYNIKEAE